MKILRPLIYAASLLLATTSLHAVNEAATDEPEPDEAVRIKGIFNSELPRTERKNFLRLTVHPHFGDFHRKDYLRLPVGVRYGITKNWEASTALEGFFAHGLGDVSAFSEYGLSGFQVGTKYRSSTSLLPGWEMGLGVDYTLPFQDTPAELTDGFEHINPYITFARSFSGWQGVRLFWGTGLDLVRDTKAAGVLDTNEFGENANEFTGGFILLRGRHTYTLEVKFATTELIGDTSQNRITVRPGIIFQLPPRLTFKSHGQWTMGIAVPMTQGPDGFDVGVSVKFRGNFNLKRLIGQGGD